jgi:tripartite-type tricarboxylate transporter receptor subunit TctC
MIKLCRVVILAPLLCTAFAWAQTPASGRATNYPARTVRVLVGFAAGGGIDAMARFYSQKFTESLGQSFVVDNRPGATGNIGADLVAKASPDGYTLLMTSTVHALNASMFAKLPFDPVKDFAPISTVATTPDCIAVHPSLPVKSLPELIALAKAKPNGLNYASAGTGTLMHVGMELFDTMAGIKLAHVPYNGAGPSTIAVIGGQVPVLSTSLGTALPHAKVGKLRMLAVTSATRTPLAPEFPSVAEAAGLPGYEALTWVVLLAPAGTPPGVINKMNAEIERLQRVYEVREQLASQAWDAYRDTPSVVVEFIKTEIVKWNKVIRASGIKAE